MLVVSLALSRNLKRSLVNVGWSSPRSNAREREDWIDVAYCSIETRNCVNLWYSKRICLTVNPRTAGGAHNMCPPPPIGFSQIAEKWRRAAPPNLVCLFIHPLRILCKNFGPRSYQVRSPDHVKWRHLKTQFSNFDTLPQPQLLTQCF